MYCNAYAMVFNDSSDPNPPTTNLEKEDCLENLQRIDSLLDDWDQSFPTQLDEILEPQGLQRLLEKISRAEQEFARRVAQERNVTITEIKTLLQQLSYGAVKSNRPQPRRRKTIF